MEGIDIKVRFGAYCISPNDKGELEFESGAGTHTKIQAEELHKRTLQAQSLEEVFEYLKDSGAYIGSENSRMMIVESANGVQIFAKDEPGRKIVIDKEVPESALYEISQINDYDHANAVRKILEAHGFDKEEMEQVFTSERNDTSFEREADNVDSRDITDNGEIAASRLERDNIQDPNRGIFNEEEARRRIEDERARQRRIERNEDRDNYGMER